MSMAMPEPVDAVLLESTACYFDDPPPRHRACALWRTAPDDTGSNWILAAFRDWLRGTD
jgi:hypothetical protein